MHAEYCRRTTLKLQVLRDIEWLRTRGNSHQEREEEELKEGREGKERGRKSAKGLRLVYVMEGKKESTSRKEEGLFSLSLSHFLSWQLLSF